MNALQVMDSVLTSDTSEYIKDDINVQYIYDDVKHVRAFMTVHRPLM